MSGTADVIPFAGPTELAALTARLPTMFLADAKSSERFWEFFAANIRNKNTRGQTVRSMRELLAQE
jgi:hypothetical protein